MMTIVLVPPPSAAGVAPAVVGGDLTWVTVWDLPVVLVVPSVVVAALFIPTVVTVLALLLVAAIPSLALFVVVTAVTVILPPILTAAVFPAILTAVMAVMTPVVGILVPLQFSWPVISVPGSIAFFFFTTALALSGFHLVTDDDMASLTICIDRSP